MSIISDTNIFLAVVLDEPEKDRIIQLTSELDAIAPEILPYEIGNALSAMINRLLKKTSIFPLVPLGNGI